MKMLPPTVTIPVKKPGRKPLDPTDNSVFVGFRLPSKKFEELCRRALREDVSVSVIIRRDLLKKKAAEDERRGKG